jgi:hypothetical protein
VEAFRLGYADRTLHRHVSSGDLSAAQAEMPAERVYPLPASLSPQIGASPALPVQTDPP